MNCNQYNGTTHISYNCITGEYRVGAVKPKGKDWGSVYEISFEDLDYLENN